MLCSISSTSECSNSAFIAEQEYITQSRCPRHDNAHVRLYRSPYAITRWGCRSLLRFELRIRFSPYPYLFSPVAAPRSADFQSAVSPNCIRQNVAQHRRASNLRRAADCKSATRRSAAEPHSKERGALARFNVSSLRPLEIPNVLLEPR